MGDEFELHIQQNENILLAAKKVPNSNGAATPTVQLPSESFTDVTNEILLKTLLSTTTVLSSTTASTSPSMIAKEINDTQLNLKKILYEHEKMTLKEKDQDSSVQTTLEKHPTDIQIDDDNRLIIDISDDEHSGQRRKKNEEKSMPILDKDNSGCKEKRSHNIERSITYSLNTTGANSSCVKIDILAPSSSYFNLNTYDISKPSMLKHANISIDDEFGILGHEIDKQMNKKTNEILELVKEYLESSISESEFNSKMNEVGGTSQTDLTSISRKLIKRHKFEPNPNQKDFMRIKCLTFPTSSKDLINYFLNLMPTLNTDKFEKMFKFYELIVKEMLKQNKTKILQYLIDFMVKRKNAELDLLNYNYETNCTPNFKQKVSSTLPTVEIADSTQNTKNEKMVATLHDTSYNFVIRSDPIYLTAGSTFLTNHRDVIKSRSTSCIQTNTFERRPFDNNILRGRKAFRRVTGVEKDEEKAPKNIVSNKQYLDENQKRINFSSFKDIELSKLLTTTDSAEKLKTKKNTEEIAALLKPAEIVCDSPILVESDTASLSPPVHKIIKPETPIKNLQQIFTKLPKKSEVVQKEFYKIPTMNYQLTAPDQIDINSSLSLNEIKTLTKNGTEIIPTSILRNTINARRKTIDVDAPTLKNSMEVKKLLVQNQKFQPQDLSSTTKTALDYIHSQSPICKKPMPKLLKRRQSCHERMHIPIKKFPENIGKNFIEFMNCEYDSKEREDMHQKIYHRQINEDETILFHSSRKSPIPMHVHQKRVRFLNDEAVEIKHNTQQNEQTSQTSLFVAKSNQNPSENSFQESSQHDQLQKSLLSAKLYQSSIDYHQYQLYFERELRERGFVNRVDALQDRETSNILRHNRPLELVSHILPERYLQHPEVSQPTECTNHRSFDKPISPHQTKSMAKSDENAAMVAYHQLQTLHKDPSSLSAQQYSEHLKQIHQMKQMQNSPFNYSQGFHRDHQNPSHDERETFFKNAQPLSHQPSTGLPARSLYEFSQRESGQIQNEKEHQSLQRKLKLKAKSSKYIEPSQLSKAYANAPHSTYYADPYAKSMHRKPSTQTTTYNPQIGAVECAPQEYLPAFYDVQKDVGSRIEYQWILEKAQHQQNLLNHIQPARPIPRPAIPSSFSGAKINDITSKHIFSHNNFQPYSNQQSEFYRNFFHSKNF